MIIAFDCWMDNRLPEDIDEFQFEPDPGEIRITYYKLMLWAAMPIVCCIGSYVVWLSISYYYRSSLEEMF